MSYPTLGSPSGFNPHTPYQPNEQPDHPLPSRHNSAASIGFSLGLIGLLIFVGRGKNLFTHGTPILIVIGLVFSIVGLIRSGSHGGRGRAKALTGLIVSGSLNITSVILVAVQVITTTQRRLDPACISTDLYMQTLDTRFYLDKSNPPAMKVDLQNAVSTLNANAEKSYNADTKASIQLLATDFQALLDDLNSATEPPNQLLDQLDADGASVDRACGR